MEENKGKFYGALHIAVILFGFTAILGDLISLDAYALVWWRLLIASVGFGFIFNIKGFFEELDKKTAWALFGIGTLVAFHWVTFYASIKITSASVALICLSTASFFTSILEPLLWSKKIRLAEVGLGLLILPGMVLVVKGVKDLQILGIVYGLVSSVLAATFTIFNKKYVDLGLHTQGISVIELISAWVVLSLLFPLYASYYNFETVLERWLPYDFNDWLWLLVLGLACTTLAFSLAMYALKGLSAFASTLTINLEPVYGIALAVWILGENKELELSFYLGAIMILISVLLHPFLNMRKQ